MITTDDIVNILPAIIDDGDDDDLQEVKKVFQEGIHLIEAEQQHRKMVMERLSNSIEKIEI